MPDSRLRLDQKPFALESVREIFSQRLEELGIARERVELICSAPHWNAYHDIDITLDCWPHNAGTTTFESLWMGVPVLSKIDRPSVGCVGATILKPLGLGDWVVEDERAYIEKAVAYAEDLEALSQLRAGLRQRLDDNHRLTPKVLTLNLEDAYRQMIESKAKNAMELTTEQALQQGVAAHNEGNLQEAERLYRAILHSQPKHPDANHNLGLIAVSVNQSAAALPLFKTALEANPKIEQFWLSYLDGLVKEQQFEAAEQVLEQAQEQGIDEEKLKVLKGQIASIPRDGNVASANPSQQQLNTLSEHYQNGRLEEAEKLALSLTQEFPTHPFGWKVLGAVLGQTDEA